MDEDLDETDQDVSPALSHPFKLDLLKLKRIFPWKFSACKQPGNLTHTPHSSSANSMSSDLNMLEQTWLSAPIDSEGKASDWSLVKDSFPNLKLGKTVMPKEAREAFGAPPFQFGFRYSDDRTQKFFEGVSWLKNGKVKLPGWFEGGS